MDDGYVLGDFTFVFVIMNRCEIIQTWNISTKCFSSVEMLITLLSQRNQQQNDV